MTDEEERDLIARMHRNSSDTLENGLFNGYVVWSMMNDGRLHNNDESFEAKNMGITSGTGRKLKALYEDSLNPDGDLNRIATPPHKWTVAYDLVSMNPEFFDEMLALDLIHAHITRAEIATFVESRKRKAQRRSIRLPAPDPTFSMAGRSNQGNALDLIHGVPDRFINLICGSPPYCDMRDDQYGIPEAAFPETICDFLRVAHPKLRDDGSVLFVLGSIIRDGASSNYIRETAHQVCAMGGWYIAQELIWVKQDGGSRGAINRFRYNFEHILWFAKNLDIPRDADGRKTFAEAAPRRVKPYCDVHANGKPPKANHKNFGSANHPSNSGVRSEISRETALVFEEEEYHVYNPMYEVGVGGTARGVNHTALMPIKLAEKLIRSHSRVGDMVLDPFAGSGTTLLAARNLGRRFAGFELSQTYVDLANDRLKKP